MIVDVAIIDESDINDDSETNDDSDIFGYSEIIIDSATIDDIDNNVHCYIKIIDYIIVTLTSLLTAC